MAQNFADDNITNALINKHNQALRDFDDLQSQAITLYEKCRINFTTLRDLTAAGRVFGIDLTEPERNARHLAEQIFMSQPARVRRLNAKPGEVIDYSDLLDDDRMGTAPIEGDTTKAMPRIRDIVLDRLKAAGSEGTRAAPIRSHIKERYGRDIHEKTVGMTLYRLANDKLAHRVGITWFFGPASPETKNPGGETPGLNDLLG